jgi:hypothetical protein
MMIVMQRQRCITAWNSHRTPEGSGSSGAAGVMGAVGYLILGSSRASRPPRP